MESQYLAGSGGLVRRDDRAFALRLPRLEEIELQRSLRPHVYCPADDEDAQEQGQLFGAQSSSKWEHASSIGLHRRRLSACRFSSGRRSKCTLIVKPTPHPASRAMVCQKGKALWSRLSRTAPGTLSATASKQEEMKTWAL